MKDSIIMHSNKLKSEVNKNVMIGHKPVTLYSKSGQKG